MKKAKKPKITDDQCTNKIQATVDALASDGAGWDMIVEALIYAGIRAAHKHRLTEALLEGGMTVYGDAAAAAFEEAKRIRAAKRRKALGLPED